jgi:dihydrofolate reductase
MGKIIVSENVALDGVVQDPAGVEGFRHGGWVGRIGDQGRDEAARAALEEALSTEAMLLGRRSYEFLAARWPSRTGQLADRMNSKPKYVVSSTLHGRKRPPRRHQHPSTCKTARAMPRPRRSRHQQTSGQR